MSLPDIKFLSRTTSLPDIKFLSRTIPIRFSVAIENPIELYKYLFYRCNTIFNYHLPFHRYRTLLTGH